MINNDYKENGFAFVMVLIVILVVGILVTAFMNSSVFNTRFSTSEVSRSRAYFAAQSGIQHLKEYDMMDLFKGHFVESNGGYDYELNDEIFSKTLSNYNQGEGIYNVSLASSTKGDPDPDIDPQIVFKSTGKYNNSKEDLFLVVTDEGLKSFGAFTTETLTLKGSVDIDGDIYVEMAEDDTTGFEDFFVNPDDNEIFTIEDGFVFDFPTSNFSINSIMSEFGFTETEIDTTTDNPLTITNKSENNVSVSNGDFLYYDNINLDGQTTLNLNYNYTETPTEPITVNLFVENGFDIKGGAGLNVSDYVNVNLWVKNSFDINGTGELSPLSTADNSKIITYLHPDIEDISLSGNIDAKVLLYGPETTFKLTGTADINGAIIAKEIKSTGDFYISITEEDIDSYDNLFTSGVMAGGQYKIRWSSR